MKSISKNSNAHLKRTLLLLLLLFIGLACSNDDSNTNEIVVDFLDNDGDGVSNEQEQIDGTEPNGPCSFLLANQEYDKTSTVWRNADCDGDGVTNGAELDPDSNGQNDNNGTDIFDSCDLDITLQSAPPSTTWMDLDCDGDCFSNEAELDAGTDPTDPDSFQGQGDFLKTMIVDPSAPAWPIITYHFEQNGALISSIMEGSNVEVSYQYDTENKLIVYDGGPIHATFTYANNEISSITSYGNSNDYTKQVTIEGNIITTDDGNAPDGYFTDKIVLDPITGTAVSKESFEYVSNDEYKYRLTTFTGTENITEVYTEYWIYKPSTDEFYLDLPGWSASNISYLPVANPFQQAFSNIYIHTLLEPWLVVDYYNHQNSFTYASSYLVNSSSYQDGVYGGLGAYTFEVDCLYNNELPVIVTRTSYDNPNSTAEIIFEYE